MKPTTETGKGIPRLFKGKFFYGWVIVAVASVVNFTEVGNFNPVLGVFVKPLEGEFGWSRTTVALAITIGTMTGAIISPLIGPILDKRGPREVIVIGASIMGVSLITLAFVQNLAHFYISFSIGRIIATGVTSLAATVAVSNWFVRRRARAMGISLLGTRAGMALLPLMVQGIITVFSWRVAWAALGIMVIVLTVPPSALFLRRRPEDVGLLPDGDGNANGVEGGGDDREEESRSPEVSWKLREAIRTPAMWLLTMASAQAFFVGGAVNLHMVPYFTDQGISGNLAVTVVTAFAIFSAVGGVVWGFVVERVFIRWGLVLVFLWSGLGILTLLAVDDLPMAFVFAAVYGLGFGGWVTLAMVVFADYFGRNSLGTIRGFAIPFQMVANSLGPVFAAWIYDSTESYRTAFLTFAFAYFLAMLWMLLARPPRHPTQAGANI